MTCLYKPMMPLCGRQEAATASRPTAAMWHSVYTLVLTGKPVGRLSSSTWSTGIEGGQENTT